MKLVDEMKDEKLGVAILYNFTKGYQDPVPMESYNIVIPLIFNDTFTKEILKHATLEEVIKACLKEDPEFGVKIKKALVDDNDITTKSQGIGVISGLLSFELVNKEMCGFANEANVLDFKECRILGKLMRGKSVDDVLSMMVTRDIKIVILQASSVGKDIDLGFFNALGDVTFYENASDDEVIALCQDATIIATNKNKITAKVMDACPKLKFIAEMATGYNNIDIEAASTRGIKVANVANYSTSAVAQHTLALALEMLQHTHEYDSYVKSKAYGESGRFSYFEYPIHELAGMTWGIVGLGAIGHQVAKVVSALGCKVIYYSASGHQQDCPYEMVDFGKLLERSDIISIHAPLNDKTYHLFKGGVFKVMKKSAYLINVGRGPIIDEISLVEALKNHEIQKAALDVFEDEPLAVDSPLYEVKDQLLLSPHVAWASVEARQRLVEEVYQNIEEFLNGRERNIVNH